MSVNIVQTESLPLFIDGKEWRINAHDLSRSHTLAEFIHTHLGRSARQACGEGGCGACSVIVTRPYVDPDNEKSVRLETFSVASCVTPLGDLAFAAVSTPQGRSNLSPSGFTPAQEALQVTNAAQCGFCTGGIVSVLDSACAGRGLSCNDVETLLDGNLCRCTGYRSISEAAQMLCDDYPGEHQEQAREIRERALAYRARMEDPENFPPSLRAAYEQLFCSNDVDGVALVERVLDNNAGVGNRKDEETVGGAAAILSGQDECILFSHVRPASLQALVAVYGEAPESTHVLAAGGASRWENDRVLSAGFTDVAYEENRFHRILHHTVSVRDVPELRGWQVRDDGALVMGAATPIGALRHIFIALEKNPSSFAQHHASLKVLVTQARYFANENVRHTGTIGGGLVSCHHLSDMIPVWVALDAQAELVSQSQGARRVPVRELIDEKAGRLKLAPDEIVTALVLPPRPPQRFIAEAFKQAVRRTDSMALVNAAISAEIDAAGVLRNACVALGGLGAPGLRARRAEAALEGLDVKPDSAGGSDLESTLRVFRDEIDDINVRDLPDDMRAYQRDVALAFLRRFVRMAAAEPNHDEGMHRFKQPPCRGRQAFNEETVSGSIVGRAMVHRYLAQHARGDTRYTVDEQLPEDGLHAAIVSAPVASGQLVEVDASPCRNDKDFVALITAADVPGRNMQGHMVHPLAEEEILCSGSVTYYGQPVALAIARTPTAAERAAAKARVVVKADELPPILTFDDIEARESWFSFEHHPEDPAGEPRERRFKRGDPDAVFSAAEQDSTRYATFEGRVEVGGQSCFYLEPQCAVAYPQEANGMRVLSSTQSPAHVARYVASALGVAEHLVDVEAGFIGGGFGGKQTRSASFAAMASIAARCLDRPVKLELSREQDMTLVPGRSPFRADYRIVIERATGAIKALDINMESNGGAAEDYSPSIVETGVFLIDNAYFIEHARIRARCGRSNLPAGFTATRGYGKPQTGAIIETILDDAAAQLGIDPQALRKRNLYTKGQTALAGTPIDDDVLRACWSGAVDRYYEAWRADCEAFNERHEFVKRGVAAVPSKGNMGFLEAADINRGSAIVRIHSDGSVRVSHSGVEMGQGINTRMSQVTAQALGVPIEHVSLDATRTADLPNTPPTTMVATDMIGAAILNACDELLVTLGQAGYPDSCKFADAARRCYEDGLPLQAQGFAQEPRLRFDWEQQQGDVSYFYVWGAALSQVEVDVSTGSWRVLKTHITQDCGRSLNPILDIGQIEGGFAFGLGYALLEKMIYLEDGSLLTDNVSSYKIPSIDDMPRDWTVEILQATEGPPGRRGLHNSKGVGEANIQLGFSAYFAVKDAIRATRRDRGGAPNEFVLPFPAMTHDILRACNVPFGEPYAFNKQNAKEPVM
ncbi:MAG: molybdopterin-dependent oxidoreductase [Rhodospirillales bacterium]